jgi:hypothetical protein
LTARLTWQILRVPIYEAGMKKAILARQQFPTNRQMLVDELKKQYAVLNYDTPG